MKEAGGRDTFCQHSPNTTSGAIKSINNSESKQTKTDICCLGNKQVLNILQQSSQTNTSGVFGFYFDTLCSE